MSTTLSVFVSWLNLPSWVFFSKWLKKFFLVFLVTRFWQLNFFSKRSARFLYWVLACSQKSEGIFFLNFLYLVYSQIWLNKKNPDYSAVVKCDLGSVCPLKGSNCYVSIYFWLQVFEVAPSLFMVEMSKNKGDTIEYQNVSIQSHLPHSLQSKKNSVTIFCL